jgi:hypothetical protein
LLANTPKILLLICQNAGKEFNACLKKESKQCSSRPQEIRDFDERS